MLANIAVTEAQVTSEIWNTALQPYRVSTTTDQPIRLLGERHAD